jgi:hypothetical protein
MAVALTRRLRGSTVLLTSMEYQCPYCGEMVDTWPDRGGGKSQSYIEDCPVCCRPNNILAEYDPDTDEYIITVGREA